MSQTWIDQASALLLKAGVENPRHEAFLFIKHYTNDKAYFPECDNFLIEDSSLLDKALFRRCAREPLAYIFGEKGFWKDNFYVGPGCLIPRPESETLIEYALSLFALPPDIFFEAGVGSGCLSLSLLKEWPQSYAMGSDISAKALFYAKKNARRLALQERIIFYHKAWLEAVLEKRQKFDLIFSNPPYIQKADFVHLAAEITDYEPTKALDGGQSGVEHYLPLAQQAEKILYPKGVLLVEIGKNQEDSIIARIESTALKFKGARSDIHQIIRVLAFSLD